LLQSNKPDAKVEDFLGEKGMMKGCRMLSKRISQQLRLVVEDLPNSKTSQYFRPHKPDYSFLLYVNNVDTFLETEKSVMD